MSKPIVVHETDVKFHITFTPEELRLLLWLMSDAIDRSEQGATEEELALQTKLLTLFYKEGLDG